MEEEIVKDNKTLELLIEETENGIRHLDGYINELDDRLTVLERQFNRINEVGAILKCLQRELGLDDVQSRGMQSVEDMKKKLEGGLDADEGG